MASKSSHTDKQDSDSIIYLINSLIVFRRKLAKSIAPVRTGLAGTAHPFTKQFEEISQ